MTKSDDVIQKEASSFLTEGLLKLCGGEKKRSKLSKTTEYSEIAKASTYNEITTTQAVLDAIIEKTWALYDSIWSGMDDDEVVSKTGWVQKNVEQFLADIKGLEDIEKKLNKPHDEGDSVMEEQIKKMNKTLATLATTVASLSEKIDKSDADPPPDDKDDELKKKEEAEDAKVTSLEKSMTDLADTVTNLADKVEKMGKVPDDQSSDDGGQPDPEPAKVKKNEDGTVNLSDMRKNTALSFKRTSPLGSGDAATAPEKKTA